jgi:hypothetical protein
MTGRIPYEGVRVVASVFWAGETVLPGQRAKVAPFGRAQTPTRPTPKSNTLWRANHPMTSFECSHRGTESRGAGRPAIWS